MKTAVHGMPRIGERRALKWALEAYWAGRTGLPELASAAAAVRRRNWDRLAEAKVGYVPSNDFSLYDHMLDAAVAVGAIPDRFRTGEPAHGSGSGPDPELTRYFAMARGGLAGRAGGSEVAPLELTKWFDTNYHHLVPEIGPDTAFVPDPSKACGELAEATALGVPTEPVLLGPLTFLTRSAPTVPSFDPMTLLGRLVEVYVELLGALARQGARWVRLDEPALVEDRSAEELAACAAAYRRLADAPGRPKIAVATYFGHVGEAMAMLADLPVDGVGLDFCAGGENLDLLSKVGGLGDKILFAGVVDGRNVWANDLDRSLELLERLGGLSAELVVSTSCSLLHVPESLSPEAALDPEVRPWLAFAAEKLTELSVLARGAEGGRAAVADDLEANRDVRAARARSPRTSDPAVR
ncbi:MAG: 5-methyltetrahydropteroyltriglutamate--homocysteine S-methyltransferase, partial [Acidimicrobiales bacterium]